MIEQVILVDANDRALGVEEKLKAHREGKLHRAFSIFLFNSKNELLLQRRALEKYHCGGLWANTCCGHPRLHESLEQAAVRRLMEEMGIACSLHKLFSFTYRSDVNHGLVEHEFDHVFVGHYNGFAYPNPAEVMEDQWLPLATLRRKLNDQSESFVPWLKIAIEKWEGLGSGTFNWMVTAK